MKTFWLHILALALAMSALVACGESTQVRGQATTIPTGTYYSNSGAGKEQLKLSGDTYLIVVNGASYVEGAYTSTSDQLTLTTSDRSAVCNATVGTAQYSWTMSGNLLTLNKMKDNCATRGELLDQTWGKR